MVNGLFQGPVRPGTDIDIFRQTGVSVPKFQGPVMPGTDIETFRRTGRTVPRGDGVGTGGGVQLGPSRQDFERQLAREKRAEETRIRLGEVAERKRQEKIESGTISGQLKTEERGVLTVTERERELGAPSTPFAVIPSETRARDSVSIGASLSEVSLPPQLPGRVQPEASLRRAREDILLAQSVGTLAMQFREDPTQFEGELGVTVEEQLGGGQLFEAGPEFFEAKIDRDIIKAQVQKDIFDRPTKDIILGRGLEVAVGGAQLGIGAGEFLGKLVTSFGVQTFEPGVERKELEFGGILGDIKRQETGTGTFLGKTLLAVPAIGIGVKQFATSLGDLGFKGAVGETITSLSPFRIPSQSFGPLESAKGIESLRFDRAVSFKQTTGDLTGRILTARGELPGVSLLGRQVTKEGVGFGITDIVAPRTTFRISGGFQEGFRFGRAEAFSIGTRGQPSGVSKINGFTFKGGLDLEGAGARAFTRQRLDLVLSPGKPSAKIEPFESVFESKTIGAISKGIGEGVSVFGTGTGRRIVRISPEGVSKTIKVSDLNIRGVEFDVGRFFGRGQTGIGIPSGVRPSPVTKQISDLIAPGIQAIKPPKPLPVSKAGLGVTGLDFAPGQVKKTTGLDSVFTKVTPRQLGALDQPVGLDVGLGVDVSQRAKQQRVTGVRPKQAQLLGSDLISAQATRQLTTPTSRQIQKQLQEPQAQLRFPAESFFRGFDFGLGAFGFAGGGIPILPGLVSERPERKKPTKGKKKPVQIRPSLTGKFLFDFSQLTGKLPKGKGRVGVLPGQIRFIPKIGGGL